MLLNPKTELLELREKVMAALLDGMPARDFRAAMILAMVGLHVTEARIRKTSDMEERRQLIHEFDIRKEIVTRALRLLGPRAGDPAVDEMAGRRALP